MKPQAALLLAALAALSPAAAPAASSDWQRVEGAAVRVVVSGAPGADGRLRAALELDLEPGWKTYWLDPGDSGVPPSVELLAGGQPGAVEIAMPAPERHSDGYSTFAGYDEPVAAALTLSPPPGWKKATLDFSVFIGICRTVCIPVQASFAVDHAANDPAEESVVDAAFAALPGAARGDFAVTAARLDGETLVAEVALPGGAQADDLFLAAPPGFSFGPPERAADGLRFVVPVYQKPDAEDAHAAVRYTLVAGGEAVSGTVALGR